MDPISNKKDFEDLTIKLRDLAYSYIEKYNPSRQQTKTFLLKKYLTKFQGSKSRKEVSEIIDKIVRPTLLALKRKKEEPTNPKHDEDTPPVLDPGIEAMKKLNIFLKKF